MLPIFAVGLVFLGLSVVSALFGFGVVSDETSLAGKLISAFFLCAAVAVFWWAWLSRSGVPIARRGHAKKFH